MLLEVEEVAVVLLVGRPHREEVAELVDPSESNVRGKREAAKRSKIETSLPIAHPTTQSLRHV